MNLKQRLKLEKGIYFLKYIFQQPLNFIGESVWDLVTKPNNWLFAEVIILIFFLWRNLFIYLINNYKFIFDKITINILLLIFITFVIKVYLGQEFQEDYKKEKEKRIMENVGHG